MTTQLSTDVTQLSPQQIDRMGDSLNIIANALALRLSESEINVLRALGRTIVIEQRSLRATERAALVAIYKKHDDKIYKHMVLALHQLGVDTVAEGLGAP